MRKKICVITGARSEYGLLKPLLKAIKKDTTFTLQLIVSAMHLSPEFGMTLNEIVEDGFQVDEKIEMLLSSDSAVGVTKSIGLGVIGFADAYSRLQPDLIILLGDRFEALAAAQAALIAKIPVAHIHGGEVTLGAYDDSIRHSITKMSHLHFTAGESYRRRVIQLGEDPKKVWMVGPMIQSAIRHIDLIDKASLEKDLDFTFGKLNFLVTYLPETLDLHQVSDSLTQLFSALEQYKNAKIIFTKANADTEGRAVNALIDHFCEKNADRAKAFVHLGQRRYLSVMKQCDVVVGNSSSGVIEAPLMHVPTVNIGNRQAGRERYASIFDCARECESIMLAIKQAMAFQCEDHAVKLLDPVEEIMKVLKTLNIESLIQKQFFDWEFCSE